MECHHSASTASQPQYMTDFKFQPGPSENDQIDLPLQQQVQRLYQHILHRRWLAVIFLWLTLAPLSLWSLRYEISLWLDYFTWTAVRYSLIYNPFATVGLTLCIVSTLTTLLWQSHNLLFGISPQYLHRLEKRVLKIQQQGRTHPLWRLLNNQQSRRDRDRG